jgi:hypothetical protein
VANQVRRAVRKRDGSFIEGGSVELIFLRIRKKREERKLFLALHLIFVMLQGVSDKNCQSVTKIVTLVMIQGFVFKNNSHLRWELLRFHKRYLVESLCKIT